MTTTPECKTIYILMYLHNSYNIYKKLKCTSEMNLLKMEPILQEKGNLYVSSSSINLLSSFTDVFFQFLFFKRVVVIVNRNF